MRSGLLWDVNVLDVGEGVSESYVEWTLDRMGTDVV